MSDETTPTHLDPPIEEFEKPKVRRISNKNPRKTPEEAPEATTPDDLTPPSEQPPRQDENSETENAEAKPDQKRTNRRRRGKKTAKEGSPSSPPAEEETINLGEATPTLESPVEEEKPRDQARNPRDPARNTRKTPHRTNADPEKVAKKAWKIFLAEVSEEGVALIGDNDARELARRCFRLAELFLEEESRRN